jgi:hypothetical protein
MATKNTETIHDLTRAEIARQKGRLVERRAQLVEERAAIFKAGATRSENPVGDDERAARMIAKNLLNGNAPPSLVPPLEVNHDKMLFREQRGVEIALKILDDKDLLTAAAEAAIWAEANADKWKTLCADIVLAANKLEALERSAQELLEQCVDITAISLPMANRIGGRPISETPVNELTEAALAAGVVTASEIKRARSS